MLATLRRIIQEVNQAHDLTQALNIVVSRVKESMGTEVCSVYLCDETGGLFRLMASDGLNPSAVGKVSLAHGEGLVSEVAERAEPLNLDNAPAHPRFHLIEETQEGAYHAFLGVPIIHHRRVLGVLIVQQQAQRRFEEDETAFLLTVAAQLSGALAHAEHRGGRSGIIHKNEQINGGLALTGLAGAPGVTLGQALVVYPPADLEAVPDRRVDDVEAEVAIFLEAVELAKADVRGMHARLSAILSSEDQALFDAYLQMLGSTSMMDQVVRRIRENSWASGALRDTVAEHVLLFESMDDPYMRERADDVRDMGRRILKCLQKGRDNPPPYPDRMVLVGEDITATMLADVPVEKLVGVVCAKGSSSSHVAILARALGVPAIMGVEDLPVLRMDGRELIVDGYSGRVYVDAPENIRAEYLHLVEEERELTAGLQALRDLPAETPDGYRLPLYANTGLISDVTPSLKSGAEGVGLYRTEFPFMVRDCFPSEDEQCRIYRRVLEAFSPRPVVLRTLDVGGDKALPYFPINEENPFLGWRGIRITLDHPELFMVQVRAMLRAASGFDNMKILLPMISNIQELDEALTLIRRAHKELCEAGVDVTMPEVGAMVEVPSLVYQIEGVVKRVDFLSIGSNDLTQYLLAVDRNNNSVAELYDSLSPAVIKAIQIVVAGAAGRHCPVSVCGEMAGNPLAVLVLLGLGVDSLSMSASSLARVKCVVRSVRRDDAKAMLDHVLSLEGAAEVRQYLYAALLDRGLAGLVRAGR